jgi:cell wall-associated NlpC family hydrolase
MDEKMPQKANRARCRIKRSRHRHFTQILTLLNILLLACSTEPAVLLEGDIIFHRSTSSQSDAIALATNSSYTHMGILLRSNEQLHVFEAIQPVKMTPLEEWIARGRNGHYVVKRLRDAETRLTPAVLAKMRSLARRYAGKDYDLLFAWDDNEMYCSELVWKIYQQSAGIEVGKREKLGHMQLDHPQVQQLLTARYGKQIPLDETVITPAAMFAADNLITVKQAN